MSTNNHRRWFISLTLALLVLSVAAIAQAQTAGTPLLNVNYTLSAQGPVAPGATVTGTVTVSNAPSATAIAQNASVLYTLPRGLSFKVDGSNRMQLSIGNLEPGQSRTLTLELTVAKGLANGTYTGIAVATATNAEQVTAAAPLEVQKAKVLGETVTAAAEETADEPSAEEEGQVLAATGVSGLDLLIVLAAASLLGAGLVLRRRLA